MKVAVTLKNSLIFFFFFCLSSSLCRASVSNNYSAQLAWLKLFPLYVQLQENEELKRVSNETKEKKEKKRKKSQQPDTRGNKTAFEGLNNSTH